VLGDAQRYNAAAAEAGDEVKGVVTDPFFACAETVAEMQQPANVHYTPAGSKALGQHVADTLAEKLPAAR